MKINLFSDRSPGRIEYPVYAYLESCSSPGGRWYDFPVVQNAWPSGWTHWVSCSECPEMPTREPSYLIFEQTIKQLLEKPAGWEGKYVSHQGDGVCCQTSLHDPGSFSASGPAAPALQKKCQNQRKEIGRLNGEVGKLKNDLLTERNFVRVLEDKVDELRNEIQGFKDQSSALADVRGALEAYKESYSNQSVIVAELRTKLSVLEPQLREENNTNAANAANNTKAHRLIQGAGFARAFNDLPTQVGLVLEELKRTQLECAEAELRADTAEAELKKRTSSLDGNAPLLANVNAHRQLDGAGIFPPNATLERRINSLILQRDTAYRAAGWQVPDPR